MGANSVRKPRAKHRAPHHRPTDDEVSLRRSEVEEALQRPNGWSAKFRALYMAKWGIGLQTCWDDRTAILEAWDREVGTETRASVRHQLVKRAQYAAMLAEGRLVFDHDGGLVASPDANALLRGISIEAKLRGANAPVEVDHRHTISGEVMALSPLEKAKRIAAAYPQARALIDASEANVIDVEAIAVTISK